MKHIKNLVLIISLCTPCFSYSVIDLFAMASHPMFLIIATPIIKGAFVEIVKLAGHDIYKSLTPIKTTHDEIEEKNAYLSQLSAHLELAKSAKLPKEVLRIEKEIELGTVSKNMLVKARRKEQPRFLAGTKNKYTGTITPLM